MAEQEGLLALQPLPPNNTCCCFSWPRNIDDAFVKEYLGGDPTFGWWRMPVSQNKETMDKFRSQMSDQRNLPEALPTLGSAAAPEMLTMMYEATKVPDVWEKVPEKLRGVYWMKGNGVGEELFVLQYGQWFEKERVLLTSMAPFQWAWPAGIPANAPYKGFMYGPNTTMGGTRVLIGSGAWWPVYPVTYSLKFNSDDLSYALINASGPDVRQDVTTCAKLVPFCPCCSCMRAKFTLEEQPSDLPEPGSNWKRGIWWECWSCTCVEFGSYDLLKVIKADGTPNEPHYSEFVKYMGDIKLYGWNGFDEEALKALGIDLSTFSGDRGTAAPRIGCC